MIKIAYLIEAHTDIERLICLCDALLLSGDVFIHIDKKTTDSEFWMKLNTFVKEHSRVVVLKNVIMWLGQAFLRWNVLSLCCLSLWLQKRNMTGSFCCLAWISQYGVRKGLLLSLKITKIRNLYVVIISRTASLIISCAKSSIIISFVMFLCLISHC